MFLRFIFLLFLSIYSIPIKCFRSDLLETIRGTGTTSTCRVTVETRGDLRSCREVGWGSPDRRPAVAGPPSSRLLLLPPSGCCCVDSGILEEVVAGPAGRGPTRMARVVPPGGKIDLLIYRQGRCCTETFTNGYGSYQPATARGVAITYTGHSTLDLRRCSRSGR